MPSLRKTVFLLLFCFVCPNVNADIIYEGFGYPANSNLSQANGGSGFLSSWQFGGFNASRSEFVIGNDSLHYSNLATSGNSVSTFMSETSFTTFNGIERAIPISFNFPGTHYLSFLIRRDGPNLNGFGFGGLYLNGNVNDVFVGKPGANEQWVIETRGGGGLVSSGVNATIGQTNLLVLKMDRTANGTDSFTLLVNPTLGSADFGLGVTKSDANLGTLSSLVLYNSTLYTYDEIRFGDTLEQVLPITTVPEPASAALILPLIAFGLFRMAKRNRADGHS